jgi:hypothetical protein
VIVEGFLLFHDPLIAEALHCCLWLDLPYHAARARRMATAPLPDKYYDQYLWPRYLEYEARTFGDSSGAENYYSAMSRGGAIARIDSTQPPAVVLQGALVALQEPAGKDPLPPSPRL